MSIFDPSKKKNGAPPPAPEEDALPRDPLAGAAEEPAPPPQEREEDKSNQIVRILDLEDDLVRTQQDDIDPSTVVSMYMPRRRLRHFGLLLLRLDKLTLALLAALAAIVILFLIAFAQEKMGNFTINLNRLELYRKGIAISEDGDFTNPTARLTASAVHDATNTTFTFLPDNLHEIDGDHNGEDYVAYTFYIRNGGKIDVGYVAQLVLANCSKGAEYAARVAVWRNGERVIYAEPARDGKPEPNCVNFQNHDIVCTFHVEDFLVGYVDKYTVVIWLEGEDPECVDAIVGGSLQFNMNIDSDAEDESSLFAKFVQDVRDTITGNDPISASGTEAPEFYLKNKATWATRRNK